MSSKREDHKQLMESAFKAIEEESDLHIIDKNYTDTYYVFESKDANTICNFKIKEIPNFMFSFWHVSRLDDIVKAINKKGPLWSDDYGVSTKSELIFFAMPEDEIDKFKPSYCGFVQGIYRYFTLKDEDEWCIGDLVNSLWYMKEHRIKSYVYTTIQVENIWDELSNFEILKRYISLRLNANKSKRIKRKRYNKAYNICKTLFNKYRDCAYMIIRDYGENWYPRLHIIIRTKPKVNYNSKQFCDFQDLLTKIDDKYFKDVSIDYLGLDIDKLSPGKEYFKDKELLDMFKEVVKSVKKDDEDVLFTNINEII